jgi:hypothetical protein
MGNLQGELMSYLKVLGIVIACTILAGCSDPKIDASSDEAMKASVEKVRESLPEAKRKEFDEAIQVLAFSQVDLKDLFAEGAAGVGNLEGKVRQSLDGKTGDQVIAEAERVQAERKERERQQALDEIRELEEKRAKVEDARKQLKNFQVIRSRFYMREQEFMGKQPIIELTVKNGTDQAVSRAYFEGTLASPDRSVPWHQDTFNYSISGGLEPGEEATWNLAPNMFSDWGKVDAPADAVFTVTVEQLDGADGEPIYSTREFGERERTRLNELKKKYGVE